MFRTGLETIVPPLLQLRLEVQRGLRCFRAREGAAVQLAAGDSDHVSARGGDGATGNGGTVKLFYGTYAGPKPSNGCAGRVYDAGPGSAKLP
jgi:hypothetical protein